MGRPRKRAITRLEEVAPPADYPAYDGNRWLQELAGKLETFTAKEVAELLKVHVDRVYTLGIPCFPVAPINATLAETQRSRLLRYPARAIADYIWSMMQLRDGTISQPLAARCASGSVSHHAVRIAGIPRPLTRGEVGTLLRLPPLATLFLDLPWRADRRGSRDFLEPDALGYYIADRAEEYIVSYPPPVIHPPSRSEAEHLVTAAHQHYTGGEGDARREAR